MANPKSLYAVEVTYEVVVYAEDEARAERLASLDVSEWIGEGDIRPAGLCASPIDYKKPGLCGDWLTACPYGNEEDDCERSCGELLDEARCELEARAAREELEKAHGKLFQEGEHGAPGAAAQENPQAH